MLKELVLLTREINGLDDPEKVEKMDELLKGIKLYVHNIETVLEIERKKNNEQEKNWNKDKVKFIQDELREAQIKVGDLLSIAEDFAPVYMCDYCERYTKTGYKCVHCGNENI